MEEAGSTTPGQANLETFSRAGSASTTASAAIAQMPAMTALASIATADSPQLTKSEDTQGPPDFQTPPIEPNQESHENQEANDEQPSHQLQSDIEAAAMATQSLLPHDESAPDAPFIDTLSASTMAQAPQAPAHTTAAQPTTLAAPAAMMVNHHMGTTPMGQSPAAHAPTPSGNLPTCQNCSTSTTPLWRRDEMGAVLCNACGLFLKLHGRPRPISLKTDVIKSRNRVKTLRPDMQKKKQSLPATANANGANFQTHAAANAAATAAALAAVRATEQKGVNGHGVTDSTLPRTSTPNVYDPNLAAFSGIEHLQHENLHYALPGTSPAHGASPGNGDPGSLDGPQTSEQLMASNASLKTRVSELDLINELYRGRLQQLEQDNQNSDSFRHDAELAAKEAATERARREEIQRQLEDSHRRENILKRRLDEMEQEVLDLKVQLQDSNVFEHPAKKLKLEPHVPSESTEQAISASQSEL